MDLEYKCPGCQTSQADQNAFDEAATQISVWHSPGQDGNRPPLELRQRHDQLGQKMLRRRNCSHPEHLEAPPPDPLAEHKGELDDLIAEAVEIKLEAAAQGHFLTIEEAIRVACRRRDYVELGDHDTRSDGFVDDGGDEDSGEGQGATEPVNGDAPEENPDDGVPASSETVLPSEGQEEEGGGETVPTEEAEPDGSEGAGSVPPA